MLILGLLKTTLLDYPGHVAATLFAGGCNFRCPYCHNRDLVLKDSSLVPITTEEILSFLNKRRNVLTGVCISGGEPTLYPELPGFIRAIKDLGYSVKLDTNGSDPQLLNTVINAGLIDYCAMDIKNAPEKYGITVGMSDRSAGFDITPINESVQILMHQQQKAVLRQRHFHRHHRRQHPRVYQRAEQDRIRGELTSVHVLPLPGRRLP